MANFIRIKVKGRFCTYLIEKAFQNKQLIRYRIAGRNRSIILQTNEPLLQSLGLRHRSPDWKLVEGNVDSPGFIPALIDSLEQLRKNNLLP